MPCISFPLAGGRMVHFSPGTADSSCGEHTSTTEPTGRTYRHVGVNPWSPDPRGRKLGAGTACDLSAPCSAALDEFPHGHDVEPISRAAAATDAQFMYRRWKPGYRKHGRTDFQGRQMVGGTPAADIWDA